MESWEDPYLRLEIDTQARLVRQVRSAVRHPSLEAMDLSFTQMHERMAAISRGDYTLLQDLRASRGRNDPGFEKLMVAHHKRISHGFLRLGVLVSTEVGRLQMQRYLDKNASQPGRTFLDEQECLRWLRADGA